MKRAESLSEKRSRIVLGRKILKKLRSLFPRVGIALTYSNNWELMVAVQLSAQCTDKKVNEVTPKLFRHYKTLHDYSTAKPKEFEKFIYQTGFFRTKTRNIIAAAKMIERDFRGVIPNNMEEILRLPGVARKTANVVLGNAYGVVEGIAVDTHVKRLSRLFGLTDEEDTKRIERDLMEIFPKRTWFLLTYYFIEYGRTYCPARRHDGSRCPISH